VLKRDKANRITIVVTHDDELLDVCDKVIRL
jgi:ABC-type lipoprotein export system ATPase subunit